MGYEHRGQHLYSNQSRLYLLITIAICIRCKKEKKIKTNNHCKQCYKNYLRERSPKILCRCGCGELIPSIGLDGIKNYYKHAHHLKGRIGDQSNHWLGGRYIDIRGYEYIRKPYHPYSDDRGYIRSHRVVKEIYLSILNNLPVYISPKLDIHHINKVKTDNRPKNLQILTRSEHGIIHGEEIRIKHRKTTPTNH